MPSALAESFSLFIPRMQMRIKADEVTVMLPRSHGGDKRATGTVPPVYCEQRH